THISENHFLILLSFSNIHSQAKIPNSTNSILNIISSYLLKVMEVSVSFSIGRLSDSFKDLPQNYEHAIKSLHYKFYTGNNSKIDSTVKLPILGELSGLSIDKEKQIISFLRNKDYDNLVDVLENLFKDIKNSFPNISDTKMIFYDILNIIIKTCKEKNIEMSSVFHDNIAPYEMLTSFETIDASKKWIISLFDNLFMNNQLFPVKYDSIYVSRTISYISKNYSKSISLSDAAEEIGIGST
ncbi:MAG: hypothetical protein ACYC5K_09570, partial [Saccharofermentanales bacterium]